MLLVAITWGIDSVIAKIGVAKTEPFIWGFLTRFLAFLILLPFNISKKFSFLKAYQKYPAEFLFMIISILFSIGLNLYALQYINPSISSVLSRFHGVFAILLAYLFLKERDINLRLTSSCIMVVGALMIILALNYLKIKLMLQILLSTLTLYFYIFLGFFPPSF